MGRCELRNWIAALCLASLPAPSSAFLPLLLPRTSSGSTAPALSPTPGVGHSCGFAKVGRETSCVLPPLRRAFALKHVFARQELYSKSCARDSLRAKERDNGSDEQQEEMAITKVVYFSKKLDDKLIPLFVLVATLGYSSIIG